MSRKLQLDWPSDEEERAINAGIAADPDNPQWTKRNFRQASRTRGPQAAPVKQPVSLRLDADVVERLRQSGPGWQSRINSLLRAAMQLDRPAA